MKTSKDTEQTVQAPETTGEFVIASWKQPETDTATKQQKSKSKKKASSLKKKPKKKERQGCFHYLFLFAKVLLIAIGSVFLFVYIYENYIADEERPASRDDIESVEKATSHDTEEPVEDTSLPNNEPANEPNTDDSGLQSLDELTPEELAEYYKGLIERSESRLEEELAKGNQADEEEISQLREDIANFRKMLKELQHQ